MAKVKAGQGVLSKASSGSLADLIGNSISVKLDDGTMLLIPADAGGNRVANMIVASNVRNILERAIKTYRDKEMIPTPKDLKDLAEAAKSLAQFSAEVYKGEEGAPLNDKPKTVEKSAPMEEVNFDQPAPEKT